MVLSRPGLFAAVWLSRHTTANPPRPRTAGSPEPGSPRTANNERRRLRAGNWARVDLYTPTPEETTRLLDDTLAVPVDAPRRLESTIDTVARRLRALPEPHELGRRSISYRSQLQRILRQARQAQTRLTGGTYGTCLDCATPIALDTLIETPWTPTCARCALVI
ncbi:hypothetical protein [Nocardioides bizhenqiangii]|uniref:DksA C4-type domain-containing protein n=1 Tax=Nocardioides bizhenqiangii TaxID=3095076 RepID=A0ABZ0ZT92_9ACTN|nr:MULTISPECIES: hypothetical protein [unclassified Nocardioides]MDZ5622866.1 hypothetical protein [Nocardioides sp. HM23]WQQ27124.1 hypothetical protein SHK19_02595 [Nocardioides sp. HM61]